LVFQIYIICSQFVRTKKKEFKMMGGGAKAGAKGASKGAAVASKAKATKNQHSLGKFQLLLLPS